MQFIRDNMFYVVLVAAVVVGGAAILAVGSAVGSDADAELTKRRNLDTTMSGLERGQPITQGVVVAEKKRVEAVDRQAKEVDAATLAWSRGTCPMFETKDFKVEGQPLPAFRPAPVLGGAMTREKLAKWKKDNAEALKDAYPEHTGVCVEMMRKLILEDLRSTTPPTPGMISREREARLGRLKSEQAEKERLEANRLKQAGAPTGKPGEGARTLHQMATRVDSVEAQAEADARAQLAVTQSEQGYIYADLWALHPAFTQNEILLRGGRAKLWDAWVQYMVCRDVAAAIRETITEALKANGQDAAKGTVAQSPIKRLQDVTVDPAPYLGAGAVGGKGGTAPNLTGHVSNTQYDVIHYRFKVVMADPYVGQLVQQLSRRNDHTVLSWQMERVELGAAARSLVGARGAGVPAADTAADAMDETLCNYGVDPVMRVTFECELLMRTSWCRDLMPEETLEKLKTTGILRPQDVARLTQASNPG